MSRPARRLVDVIAALSLGLLVVGVGMSTRADPSAVLSDVIQGFGFVVCFGGVGWILVRRLPGNPIGWWFSLGALFTAVTFLAHGWARLAVAGSPAPDALARAAAAVDTSAWMLAIPFAVPLPLLFLPNGHLRSRRWRPVVWMVLVGCVVGTAGALTTAGPIDNPLYPAMGNPMGMSGLASLPSVLASIGFLTLVAGALLGMLALVLRFRGSSGVERQQTSLGRARRNLWARRHPVRRCQPGSGRPGNHRRHRRRPRRRSGAGVPGRRGAALSAVRPGPGGEPHGLLRGDHGAARRGLSRPRHRLGAPAAGRLVARRRSVHPWPLPPCSSRSAGGCRRSWTVDSTGAATTPSAPWPPTPTGCVTRSISTR